MKTLAWTMIIVALVAAASFAEDANGFRVTVQKTTLERDKDRHAFSGWDTISKALGLKVYVRNISMADMGEGTLEYLVIARRWGYSPQKYESYAGTEKVPALLKGVEANLTVGKVPLGGYEAGGNRKQYQDSIEGWQIIVKHNGKGDDQDREHEGPGEAGETREAGRSAEVSGSAPEGVAHRKLRDLVMVEMTTAQT